MGYMKIIPKFEKWKIKEKDGERYLERETIYNTEYKVVERINLESGKWSMVFQVKGEDFFGFESPTLAEDFRMTNYHGKVEKYSRCTYSEGVVTIEDWSIPFLNDKTVVIAQGFGINYMIDVEMEEKPTIYEGLRELIEGGYLEKIIKTYSYPATDLLYLLWKVGIDSEAPHEQNKDILEKFVDIFTDIYKGMCKKYRKGVQREVAKIWGWIDGDRHRINKGVEETYNKIIAEMMRIEQELESAGEEEEMDWEAS